MSSDRELRESFIAHMDAAQKTFPYHFGNWVRFYNKASEAAPYCINCDTWHASGDTEHGTDVSMAGVYAGFRAKLLEEPQQVTDSDGKVLV